MNQQLFQSALQALRQGGLIVYPTEAVYGLGCAAADEQAVARLLQLKQRPMSMGLISIISDLQQIEHWLDSSYRQHWYKALDTWPAATTWLFPSAQAAPVWLTGAHRQRLAVRLPDHALCRQLCAQFGGPIVSTSANVSGTATVSQLTALDPRISSAVDVIIPEPCGGRDKPSSIKDLLSEAIVRR